jgi:DNA-binding MarR family transcriptional regulator
MTPAAALDLVNRLLRAMSDGEAPVLSAQQAAMLMRVCLAGDVATVGELAVASGVTRVAAADALDRLDDAGLVACETDGETGTDVTVTATEAGLALVRMVADHAGAGEQSDAGRNAA